MSRVDFTENLCRFNHIHLYRSGLKCIFLMAFFVISTGDIFSIQATPLSSPHSTQSTSVQSLSWPQPHLIQKAFKKHQLLISIDDAQKIHSQVQKGLLLLGQKKTKQDDLDLILLEIADLLYLEMGRCSGNLDNLKKALSDLSRIQS